MYVIGVAGQARFGKDCLADKLCEILNKNRNENFWTRASFANGVKGVFCDAFGVSREFIEEWKVRDSPPPGFDMNVRKGLQFIGDGFRTIRSTVWVDIPFQIKTPKIISDVRYPNEFHKVYEKGGINILIGRTDKLNDDPNGSEALIKPYVEWALAQENEDEVNHQLHISRSLGSKMKGAPQDMNKFHLFVRNDGTLEELYDKINDIVVPYVEKFTFKKE